MGKGLNDFLGTLSPADRERAEARGAELIAEEMTLRSLRQAHDLTQERMAELLGVKQENVSRLERRTDLLLSTMASYVEAMGGRLRLVAEFPGQKPVVIKALGEIGGADAADLKAA
jgi:DNA-binding XRE family transcriptional regulator